MSQWLVWLRYWWYNSCPKCGAREWYVYTYSRNRCYACMYVGD